MLCVCVIFITCFVFCLHKTHYTSSPPLSYYILVVYTYGLVDLCVMFSPTPYVCRYTITISIHVLLVLIQLYCSHTCLDMIQLTRLHYVMCRHNNTILNKCFIKTDINCLYLFIQDASC